MTLYPYGLISRGGTPPVSGYAILHEGFIGYLGDQGLQELTYKNVDGGNPLPDKPSSKGTAFSNVTNAWLGITDKYWAAALIPELSAASNTNGSSPPTSPPTASPVSAIRSTVGIVGSFTVTVAEKILARIEPASGGFAWLVQSAHGVT